MQRPQFEQGEYGLLREDGSGDPLPTKKQRYSILALIFILLVLIIVLFVLYAGEDSDTVKKVSVVICVSLDVIASCL